MERALSLASAAARGGAVTLVGQLLRFVVQVASVAILARLVNPEDYGLYTMVFAVLGIAGLLGDFGLSMAAIQSQTITNAQRTNLFWTNLGLGVVLFTLVLAVAPLLSAFYGEPQLTGIAQWMAMTFLFNAIAAQFRAETSARLKFTSMAVVDVVAIVSALVVAVTVAVMGGGFWALVAQQIALTGVTLVGLVIVAGWWPGLPRRTEGMRALYSYGANTLGVQAFVYVTSNIDSILIGRVWGPTSLGLYDRAFRIFRLPLQQIAAPMTKVGVPILSRLQDEAHRFEAYVQRAQLVLGYGFGGMFFVLTALSDPLIDLLLGQGWEPAKPIFAVLAIGGVFQGMGFVYSWIFLSKALTGLQLRWTIIGRSAMVAAMVVGVAYGPLGVAAGATVGQAINWALLTIFPISQVGVARGPLLKIALRPIMFFTPLAVLGLYLSYGLMGSWNPWLQAAVLGGIVVAYLGLGLLIRPIRRDYVQLLDVARRLRR